VKLSFLHLSTSYLPIVACLYIVAVYFSTGAAQECEIKITAPRNGARVGETGTVDGTAANIPHNAFLWVLVHRADRPNQWWPQGGPISVDRDGKWKVDVYYGTGVNAGRKLDIAPVLVTAPENDGLKKWIETAPQKGSPPTPMPNTVEGCPPASSVTVVKNG
jgi:hypothetical protein